MSKFARLIHRSDAVVHQLRSGHRSLGDALARHIEIACGLPQGWFDTDDDVPPQPFEEQLSTWKQPPMPISTALPVVLDAIQKCQHREELRTLLALIVDVDAPAYRQRLAELLGARPADHAAIKPPVESRSIFPPLPAGKENA